MAPLVPKPGDHFFVLAKREQRVVADVEGLRTNGHATPDYLVRSEHGARWLLTLNPGEALDGVTWIGEPLPADPSAEMR
jgi:hypothetical protein